VSPTGLRRLTAVADEADGGRNQGIVEESADHREEIHFFRGGETLKSVTCFREERDITSNNLSTIGRFKICAGSSGDSATQKHDCFL
jgi:hypothetical protein